MRHAMDGDSRELIGKKYKVFYVLYDIEQCWVFQRGMYSWSTRSDNAKLFDALVVKNVINRHLNRNGNVWLYDIANETTKTDDEMGAMLYGVIISENLEKMCFIPLIGICEDDDDYYSDRRFYPEHSIHFLRNDPFYSWLPIVDGECLNDSVDNNPPYIGDPMRG